MHKECIQRGALIKEVLRLLNQRWSSPSDIDMIPSKLGISALSLGTKIFTLNQILETFRAIPEQYFKDTEQRENILESAQEALDDLIEQEEEEEREIEDDDDGFDISFDI